MANLAKYPLEDNFSTTLTQELDTTTLTINVAATPNFTFPGGITTYLTLNPGKSNQEVVEIESYDSSAKTVTIKSGGRNVSQGATVTTTAQTHAVGSKAIISDNFKFWEDMKTAINSKVSGDEDTTLDANFDFTADDATVTFRTPNMTTANRDSIASPANGMLIYNTTDGENQMYDGGAWQAIGSASVPNASTTVAGVVEEATDAEVGAGTAAGGTGAQLFINPASAVKTSSGAGDENKIPVLNASGELASGFLGGVSSNIALLGDGSDGALSVPSGTTNINTGTYNYSSITVAAGATLSTTSTSGNMFLKCTGQADISGTIDLSGKLTSDNDNEALYSVVALSPGTIGAGGAGGAGQTNGAGAGGSGGAGSSDGYGGGGGGAGAASGDNGKNGQAGGYPAGSNSGGGNSALDLAAGGTAYGGAGSTASNLGGGGAGGERGYGGISLAINTSTWTGSGTIDCSGAAGEAGGAGGNDTTDGGGGGGGGGGAGGAIRLVAVTGTFGGTITSNGGGGGAGGAGNSATDGTAGSAGTGGSTSNVEIKDFTL